MLEHVVQLLALQAREVAGQLLGAHPSLCMRESLHVVDALERRPQHGVEVVLDIVRDNREARMYFEEIC